MTWNDKINSHEIKLPSDQLSCDQFQKMYTLNTKDKNFYGIELSSHAYTMLKNDNVITFQSVVMGSSTWCILFKLILQDLLYCCLFCR